MALVRYRLLDGEVVLWNGVPVGDPGAQAGQQRSAGTTVERALAVLDQRLPAIDRCLASKAVPPTILEQLVSASYAANLRRAARVLHRELHARLRELRVPMRALLNEIASHEDRAEQAAALDAWQADRIERLGRPRARMARAPRRDGTVRSRDRRVFDRLVERNGRPALRRLLAGD